MSHTHSKAQYRRVMVAMAKRYQAPRTARQRANGNLERWKTGMVDPRPQGAPAVAPSKMMGGR